MASSEGTENQGGPVSYIRSHVSDLPKVSGAFKRMVFNDERCQSSAEALTDYWKKTPDSLITAIHYDAGKKLFVLSHRVDGRFTMAPERFFRLVAKKAVQLLSEEVSNRIKSLLESPKEE